MSDNAVTTNPEMLVIVDGHDQQIGIEEKIRTHELGLLHRAFSVFIFRQTEGALEVLLQQRQLDKYHCGGLWTNTCCSHPRVGEDIVQAGERRLLEEMGIITKIIPVGSFSYRAEFANGLIEHEYDHVLVGTCGAEKFVFNIQEVAACKWIEWGSLLLELQNNPQIYTPWLSGAAQIINANLIQVKDLLFNSNAKDALC